MGIAYNTSIVRNGLVLHLDAANAKSYAGSGTIWKDLSGLGNNATLINGVSYSADNLGTMSFDGTDDYAQTASGITAITNVTLQCWVNISSTSMKGTFVKVGTNVGGYSVGVGTSTTETAGNKLVMLYPGIRWIPTGYDLGTGWKMITMTINSTSVPSAFINTSASGTFGGASPAAPAGGFAVGRNIGDEPGQLPRAFGGKISSVLIYNRVLTSEEIKQNFEATRGRYGI